MFWLLGFGLLMGEPSNGFMGLGDFAFQPKISAHNLAQQTSKYSSWLFHFAFASTATTIVSGSVAGRMKMSSYTLWALLSPVAYAIMAHWAWADKGWLFKMGFSDFAGSGPVHLYGACGGLAGAILVGPRLGRFDVNGKRGKKCKEIYEPENVIAGTLILWWGWIGFNCGSTFGTTGIKASIATRVGVVTVVATIAGASTELLKVFLPSARDQVKKQGTLYKEKAGETISDTLQRAKSVRIPSVRISKRPTAPSDGGVDSNSQPNEEEEEEVTQEEEEQHFEEAERKVAQSTTGTEDDDGEDERPASTRRTSSFRNLWGKVEEGGDRRPSMRRASLFQLSPEVRERAMRRLTTFQLPPEVRERAKTAIRIADNRIKVPGLTNAILSALVAITAPCNCVTPRMAIVIGAVAPFISDFANQKVEQYGVDDPCGAIGVHGAAGIWGLMSVALFSKADLSGNQLGHGFVYDPREGIHLVGIQALGALAIFAWGLGINLAFFKFVEFVTTRLRVEKGVEMEGLDSVEHGTASATSNLLVGRRSTGNEGSRRRKKYPRDFEGGASYGPHNWCEDAFDEATGSMELVQQQPRSPPAEETRE